MSFVHRKIDVVLTMATGPDAGVAQTLSGHRVQVSAQIAGGASMSEVTVRIFGMTDSRMNDFSTLGQLPTKFNANVISVLASDDAGNMSQIFEGTILAAYADFLAAPDVSFVITGLGGLYEALQSGPGFSSKGPVSAAVVLQELATQAGLKFENNGVNVMLPKCTYNGSLRTQIQECIEDARIDGVIHLGTLSIWPLDGARAGDAAVISPGKGMVGYPSYTATGVIVTTLFNPEIRFGALVQIEGSVLRQANGTWNVVTLVHELESEVPNGKWFTQLELVVQGQLAIPSK